MIKVLGIFFILLGILLDDGTTFILFMKGFGVAEMNPIFLTLGGLAYTCIMIILYIFIILTWNGVIKTYKKVYSKKGIFYKLYDIFVFLFCVFIIFFAAIKIELGYNNFQDIGNYMDEEQRPTYEANLKSLEEFRESDPEGYKAQMTQGYYDGVTNNLSYGQLWFIILFGYLLFRVGHKVSPYEYA